MQRFSKLVNRDLIETILVVLLFILLLYALYNVLQVFFGVLTFALVFAVSFLKPYEFMVKKMKGKRKPAAVLYALLLIILIAFPLTFLIASMSHHLKQVELWVNTANAKGLPPLPVFIAKLPYAGPYISSFWSDFQQSPKETLRVHEHQLNSFLRHIITAGLGVLGVALQFVLGIIISAFLLERGDNLLSPLKATVRHLAGEQQGNDLLLAISQAIKGVSIGVMSTGFIAAFIAWTGLAITGIPFAVGIAALIFFLVVIQVGALVVWVPLVIWEGLQGHRETTIILAVYLVIIIGVELIVKPVLIARSGKLPFLVLFLGVIGGLAAWGFTGMFKGAIVTAVFYTIFTAWLARRELNVSKEASDISD